MLLAALLDAGAPLAVVRDAVHACGVDEVALDVEEVSRAGMRGLHLRVGLAGTPRERSLGECVAAIEASGLAPGVRSAAITVVETLGAAEAAVHGPRHAAARAGAAHRRQPGLRGSPADVHLHELSAADTLVDVVGVCAALQDLGVDDVRYGPLPVGHGTVETEHGLLPLPAPATMHMLAAAGAALTPAPDGVEHVTPTAAALLTTLGRPGSPAMQLRSIGHGAGTRDDPRRPNIARCWLGVASRSSTGRSADFDDRCVELTTNLDDATPAVIADVLQRCLQAGALDAWVVAATMKKGRPGHVLHVLSAEGADAQIAALLLATAPTLGVRRTETPRMVAERDVVDFESPLGPVRVKCKRLDGSVADARPEMDDCRSIADRTGMPLHQVVDTVTAAARAAFLEERRP
jgi:uncharacterized protein (TIGR00299 family) protein